VPNAMAFVTTVVPNATKLCQMPPNNLSIYLYLYISISLYIYISIYLYIYISIYISI
jgi:hypothetical protein